MDLGSITFYGLWKTYIRNALSFTSVNLLIPPSRSQVVEQTSQASKSRDKQVVLFHNFLSNAGDALQTTEAL
jgi:hypothetical protein